MAESTEVMSACLNLMRRLPPKDIENSLAGLLNLVPDATDELLQRVDQVTDPLALLTYLYCYTICTLGEQVVLRLRSIRSLCVLAYCCACFVLTAQSGGINALQESGGKI